MFVRDVEQRIFETQGKESHEMAMKQRITPEQLNELTDEQKKKLKQTL